MPKSLCSRLQIILLSFIPFQRTRRNLRDTFQSEGWSGIQRCLGSLRTAKDVGINPVTAEVYKTSFFTASWSWLSKKAVM